MGGSELGPQGRGIALNSKPLPLPLTSVFMRCSAARRSNAASSSLPPPPCCCCLGMPPRREPEAPAAAEDSPATGNHHMPAVYVEKCGV